MGEQDEAQPYPARTSGYVDCLNASQEDALAELCKKLPAAFEGLATEHLTLWGVSLADLADTASQQQLDVDRQKAAKQPDTQDAAASDMKQDKPAQHEDKSRDLSGFNGPGRAQRVVLLKFLRARQFNVQAALAMLVNCLKWRRDFDVAGLALETFPQQLGAAGQLSGRDRAGNPVTYNYYGADLDLESVFGSPGGVATFVRWRVKLMEQAVGLLNFECGVEHVTQVHDYSGASMFRMDSHVKAASRQIIRLFQDNYPEMLSAKLFVNVPRVMEFIFGIFSKFSDAATRAKFVMVSPARARSVLLQYIDPVQVPSRFGGFLETCMMPPNKGRATSFSNKASKKVTLKPGESHVTSKIVGPDSEVVWCFCTTGPELNVTLGFRPRDNGEAAAAAARLPDHMPGVAHPTSRHRDAQHINESHNMCIVKDAASGRLVLGCPGEVTMTLDNTRATPGFFGGVQPVVVHYTLLSNEPSGNSMGTGVGMRMNGAPGPGSEPTDADAAGSGRLWEASQHPLDWRTRIISYKSFGCSSFASNDVCDASALENTAPPESPTARGVSGNNAVGAGPGSAGPFGGAAGAAAAAVAQGQGQGQQPQQQQAVPAGTQQSPALQGWQSGGGGGLVPPVTPARFETVQEADESGTVSPARTTLHDGVELRAT